MKTIGIAGGGQLGRMLTEAAHGLGFKVIVLDPTPGCPASQVAEETIVGDYKDASMIEVLSKKCDVLTYEIESVNAEALVGVSEHLPVHPTPHTLSIIKDKLKQKEFLASRGIPVAPFSDISMGALDTLSKQLGFPMILKTREGGFDGRGNVFVESASEIPKALEQLGNAPAYAEGFVRFEQELAIVAARTVDGDIQIFPLVETIHRDHICHLVLVPAPVSEEIARKAHDLAQKVLASFDGAGVFAIEMFLVDDEVLVNEIAPRVHNSGHFTIEACATSQFSAHIRAITGMPLGDFAMNVPAACMINILGDREGRALPHGLEEVARLPGVFVHIYGKMETRPQRKMGHVTAIADRLEKARANAEKARSLITI